MVDALVNEQSGIQVTFNFLDGRVMPGAGGKKYSLTCQPSDEILFVKRRLLKEINAGTVDPSTLSHLVLFKNDDSDSNGDKLQIQKTLSESGIKEDTQLFVLQFPLPVQEQEQEQEQGEVFASPLDAEDKAFDCLEFNDKKKELLTSCAISNNGNTSSFKNFYSLTMNCLRYLKQEELEKPVEQQNLLDLEGQHQAVLVFIASLVGNTNISDEAFLELLDYPDGYSIKDYFIDNFKFIFQLILTPIYFVISAAMSILALVCGKFNCTGDIIDSYKWAHGELKSAYSRILSYNNRLSCLDKETNISIKFKLFLISLFNIIFLVPLLLLGSVQFPFISGTGYWGYFFKINNRTPAVVGFIKLLALSSVSALLALPCIIIFSDLNKLAWCNAKIVGNLLAAVVRTICRHLVDNRFRYLKAIGFVLGLGLFVLGFGVLATAVGVSFAAVPVLSSILAGIANVGASLGSSSVVSTSVVGSVLSVCGGLGMASVSGSFPFYKGKREGYPDGVAADENLGKV